MAIDAKYQVVQHAAFNLLGTAGAFIITAAISVLLSRWLGAETYGIYSSLMWLLASATTFMYLAIGQAISKYVAEFTGRGDPKMSSAAVLFGLMIVLTLGLAEIFIMLVTRRTIGQALGLPSELWGYIPLLGIGAALSALSSCLSSVLIGLRDFRRVALGNLFVVTGTTLLVSVAWIYYKDIISMTFAVVFSQLMSLIIHIGLVRRSGLKIECERDLINNIRRDFMCYWLIAAGIALINLVVWERSGIFFLTRYSSLEQVAYYSLAFSLGSAAFSVGLGAIAGVLTPAIAYYGGQGDRERVTATFREGTRYMGILSGLAYTICMILASPALKLLYGPEYASMIPVFRIILLGGIAGAVGRVTAATVYGTGRHGIILKTGIPIALASIAMNAFLIPKYGAMGAGWANTISQVITVIVVSHCLCRSMKTSYPFVVLFRVSLASLASTGIGLILIAVLPELIGAIVALTIGVIVFGSLLVLTRELNRQDLLLLQSFQGKFTITRFRKNYDSSQ